MAIQVLANLITITPSLGTICTVHPALLDRHTSSRHQDFLSSVFAGYFVHHRADHEIPELVYHHSRRLIESNEYIHHHKTENHILINRYYHYQQAQGQLPVNQQHVERQTSISSKGSGASNRNQRANNNQLAIKALSPLPLKSTLTRPGDNTELLSLQQVLSSTAERQTIMANLRFNLVEQPKSTDDSQSARLAQPLPTLWHSYSGKQVSRFLPLFQQAEQLVNDLATPRKLDAIIERQISSNSHSHASKRDKQPDDEKYQKKAQVLVSHPLILNTFNEQQQLKGTYLSRFPQHPVASSPGANAGTATNSNFLAQYQYNIQYRALRQNMPYSVSRGLAANMRTGNFDSSGNFLGSQTLNYLKTDSRFSAGQQLHDTYLSKLSVLTSQLKPSVELGVEHLNSATALPHYKVQHRALLQGLVDNEQVNSLRQTAAQGYDYSNKMSISVKNRSTRLDSQYLPYKQPHLPTSVVPSQQVSPTTKPMPRSHENLVYTTKDKPVSSFSSSAAMPSSTTGADNQPIASATSLMATPKHLSTVTSEQQDQQPNRRAKSGLSKTQTRLVADEVYQLINQRLRFEKRRRGVV